MCYFSPLYFLFFSFILPIYILYTIYMLYTCYICAIFSLFYYFLPLYFLFISYTYTFLFSLLVFFYLCLLFLLPLCLLYPRPLSLPSFYFLPVFISLLLSSTALSLLFHMTTWPSGLRRVTRNHFSSGGVGSNPAVVVLFIPFLPSFLSKKWSHPDSNWGPENQNLICCPYTIGPAYYSFFSFFLYFLLFFILKKRLPWVSNPRPYG